MIEIDYTWVIVVLLTTMLFSVFASYKLKGMVHTWGIMMVILPNTWEVYYRGLVVLLIMFLAGVIRNETAH